LATGNVTVTTAANFVPELWSSYVIEATHANLVFGNLVDRRYEANIKRAGDTIHVPSLAAMTVGTKTAGNAVVFSVNTETMTNISVDTDSYVAIRIDNIAEVQSQEDLLKLYTNRAGYDLATTIDTAVANLVDTITNNVGTLAVSIIDDDLIRAVQYLDDANAARIDRSWVMSPATFGDLLKIDKFVRLDYVSPGGKTAVETAKLNHPIYGADVYVTTQVEGDNTNGHDNVFMQKECITLVMQQEPKTYTQFMIEYLSDAVVIEAIYGVKLMRADHGVWIKAK